MPSFIMLSRLAPEAFRSPPAVDMLENKAVDAIVAKCRHVKWLNSYAVLGPYDYLDIFEAPDIETATKVSTLMRAQGRASSEVWPVTDLDRVKQMLYATPP